MRSGNRRSVGILTLLTVLATGAAALSPLRAHAADGCKVKVLKTGEIQVAAKDVGTNPRWGTTTANISQPFSNEGACYDPIKLNLKKCNIADPTTLAGVTMPATCQLCVGDDGVDDCCTRIKKCTPGIRVRDASFASGDPRFEAFEIPNTSTMLLSGVNLQIVNGNGQTSPFPNGKGNLIIGYNEQNLPPKPRTGSHNLVIGMDHGWSSYGGLVAGNDNNITGAFSTVTGGYSNLASGSSASVSGGQGNIAAGNYSSISGGGFNHVYAGTLDGSISGGGSNKVTANWGSVSGGFGNEARGEISSVSGGFYNVAAGRYSSITGGQYNYVDAAAELSVITGGGHNAVYNTAGTISGGTYNSILVHNSGASTPTHNTIGGGNSLTFGTTEIEEWHAARASGFPTGTEY